MAQYVRQIVRSACYPFIGERTTSGWKLRVGDHPQFGQRRVALATCSLVATGKHTVAGQRRCNGSLPFARTGSVKGNRGGARCAAVRGASVAAGRRVGDVAQRRRGAAGYWTGAAIGPARCTWAVELPTGAGALGRIPLRIHAGRGSTAEPAAGRSPAPGGAVSVVLTADGRSLPSVPSWLGPPPFRGGWPDAVHSCGQLHPRMAWMHGGADRWSARLQDA